MSECQTQDEVCEALAQTFYVDKEEVARFAVLVAYVSEGPWGCDSSAYVLLRDWNTGEYYEVFGSHCSCYGFEEQWDPDKTDIRFLKSDKFCLPLGGYDDEGSDHIARTKEFIAGL